MNGLASDSEIVAVTPLWKWALYVADVVIGLLLVAGVVLVTRKLVRQRRAGAPVPAGAAPDGDDAGDAGTSSR
jgi:cytochrome c oxidase assembly factor CtaG